MDQASLLVRRADRDQAGRVATRLGVPAEEMERCAVAGGLFVLADIFWDGSSDPLAVLAVSPDHASRRAHLRRLVVSEKDVPRLLAGVAMLMTADGMEVIEADGARAGSELRDVLRRAGFGPGEGDQLLYWL